MTRQTKPQAPETYMVEKGGGKFEWHPVKEQQVEPEPLTTLELAYLQRHHKSQKVNTDRAQAVKTYREQGATLAEIAAYLRGKPGCGRRMIATDLAALSEAKRKTRLPNAMHQDLSANQ